MNAAKCPECEGKGYTISAHDGEGARIEYEPSECYECEGTGEARSAAPITRVVHNKREAFDIYIGRPSKWGNPYKVASNAPREVFEHAVDRYRSDLVAGKLRFTVDDVVSELRGHDLACWCRPGAACHGEVLLEIANQ